MNKQGYTSRQAGIHGAYKDNCTLFSLYPIHAVKIMHIY